MKRSFAISNTGGRLSLVVHYRDDSGTRHTRLLRRYDLDEREAAERERQWLRSIASDPEGPLPIGANGHFEAMGLKVLSESFPLHIPAAPHLLLLDALSFLSWAAIWVTGDTEALVSRTQTHLSNTNRADFLRWLEGREKEELAHILRYNWELPSRVKEGKC